MEKCEVEFHGVAHRFLEADYLMLGCFVHLGVIFVWVQCSGVVCVVVNAEVAQFTTKLVVVLKTIIKYA